LSGADASPGIRADKASFHHRHRSRWVCFESRFGFFFIGNPSCAGPAQIKKRLPLLFTRTGAETAPAVPPWLPLKQRPPLRRCQHILCPV